MSQALEQSENYTPQEYLEMERLSHIRHEYYKGRIFVMAGASINHNRIVLNLSGLLFNALRGSTCEAFATDQRLLVQANGLYTYPDTMIICGGLQIAPGTSDTITNPIIIFEVLSDSTANYDRTAKFELYKGLASLQQYILIEPDHLYVQSFRRVENNLWALSSYLNLTDKLSLIVNEVELELTDIYSRVQFTNLLSEHPEPNT